MSENSNMSTQGKSVIVVLGMHRSGTSAITRGLQVMGVDLGSHLMPPAAGNNEKGFFEDTEVNAINAELLSSMGQDWHTLALVQGDDLLDEKHAALRLRAIKLLRSRLRNVDCFGMKDPRMCRLLPFWQRVFEYLQLNIAYVITVRNPLSVASSLEARDKIPPEKSYYLWLEHILPSVLLTNGKPRVLVDYDRLMAAPKNQISRMAAAIGFKGKLDNALMVEFSRDFLDEHLRHSIFELKDVFEDPFAPQLVRQAASVLADIAADKISLDSEYTGKVFARLAEQLHGMSQAMNYLNQLDNTIAQLNKVIYDKDVHIGNIERAVGERDGQVALLSQAAHDKDVHIGNIERAVGERDGHLRELSQRIAERENEVAILNQSVHDKDMHIGNIEQAVVDRDERIEELSQRIAERENEIVQLSQAAHDKDVHIRNIERAVGERDGHLRELSQRIAERENEITLLRQAAHGKDTCINKLDQLLVERNQQIVNLDETLAERGEQIGGLTQTLEEMNAQLAMLTKAVHDKDVHINNLDQAAAERNAQIELLTKDSTHKDKSVHQLYVNTIQLDYRLKQAHAALGWKLTKPLRMINGLWGRFIHKLNIELIPLAQLQRIGDEWESSGTTPQFLVMAECAWHGLSGWYWLNIEVIAGQPLNAKLYFDAGEGFDPTRVINFLFSGQGLQRIPFFVPPDCRAIRLDPCDLPATFKLYIQGLTRLKEAPELPEEFLAQSAVYEALGGRAGNAAALEPVNDIQRNGESDYCWRSEGSDPWFILKDISHELRPGWYMIELCIRSNHDRGNAKLYFDYGEGYSETASVALPFGNGQVVKRLYHLATVPRQIRFDPLEGAAKFSVEHLHFAPVMSMFARNRMLRRLSNHYAHYKGQSIGHIWRDLQNKAKAKKVTSKELLFQRYNETFPANGLHNSISYAEWIAKLETPEFSDLANIEMVQKSFEHQPTISVVMPAYNTEESFLRQAIESVLAQSYPYWELCIADDASPKPHVRAVLEEYAQRDPRIKVAYRPKNGHISAASNSALALATGEYVALMDHDDTLAQHALHFMVEAINQNPSAQILYSDEDKIDEQSNRSEPHFKPDWNPDLFFSQNYVSHLGVYRRELLQRIEGFRIGVEGSQDQDLLLRCLPYVNPAEIVHIPKVLYHWRMVEGSTALASGEKSYTTEAGIKALRDFFSTQGQDDTRVEAGIVPNTYRVRYPIPQPVPLVSLLIPTRDMLEMLEPCIRSILDKTTYQNYEIIILDNESVQIATLDYFERIQAEDTRVRVLPYHHPFNYSAINNYGVQHARGELIGLINNDIEVISPEWLTEMVSHALRPGIGCVGAKLYYADNTIQHAGVILGIGGVANHPHKNFPKQSHGYFARLSVVQNFSAVTAACLLVRKAIYEEVGGLEEEYLKVAFNDIDFCLKVREAGYRNLWTPYAELYHHESKSRGTEDTPEKQARFISEVLHMQVKWKDQLVLDLMYSPNLTSEKDDFSIGTHIRAHV